VTAIVIVAYLAQAVADAGRRDVSLLGDVAGEARARRRARHATVLTAGADLHASVVIATHAQTVARVFVEHPEVSSV